MSRWSFRLVVPSSEFQTPNFYFAMSLCLTLILDQAAAVCWKISFIWYTFWWRQVVIITLQTFVLLLIRLQMKVAKKSCFDHQNWDWNIKIHAILKLKYSKQSKFKSNWPHISVIEIGIHFKIEITLYAMCLPTWTPESAGAPPPKIPNCSAA